MFSVWGNWRAEGKVYFVKVSNTGCNGAKINRHNHAFLNRPFSTILFSHWQSTSNYPHEYGEYTVCVDIDGFNPRITPMSMGNTRGKKYKAVDDENHPHEYGEYKTACDSRNGRIESPPCVWGVLAVTDTIVTCLKNHPHMYGEYRVCKVGKSNA